MTKQKAAPASRVARAAARTARPRSKPGPAAARPSRKTWERAYEGIKDLILTLAIKPGETVSENRLARSLGISRTPVREALNRLEQEGLVISSRRRKRAFVLTIAEVEEIFDLKIAIERSVARWAAERGADEGRERFRQALQRMQRVASARPAEAADLEGWHRAWLEADGEYHRVLFGMAGNRRAEQIVDTVNNHWHRLRLGILAIEDRIEKSVVEHTRIAEAVLARDGGRAETLMAEHLQNLKVMLVGIMKAFRYPG
jgi:DNA-binding GntR family transcriptional regulator